MNSLFFCFKKACTHKLIPLFTAASLILPFSVGAQDEGASAEAYVDYAEKCISVSYTSDIPYVTDVMFYLVGETDEFESLSKSLRVGSAKLIPGEGAQCTVPVGDDIADGRYRLYVIPGGYASGENTVYSPSFRYMDSSARDTALETINGSSADKVAQIAFEYLSDVFDFEEPEAPAWKNEYIYAAKKEDCGGSFTDISEVYGAWKTADVLAKVNSSSASELADVIEQSKDILGVDMDNEYYREYTEEAVRIIEIMADENSLMSKTSFGNAFSEASVVAAVNKAGASRLDDIFTDNSHILGIDAYMDRYEDVSKTSFARQFDGFGADSADEVKEKFVSVLEKLEASANSSSGGSSGGGGGGSRGSAGGGNISIAPTEQNGISADKKSFVDTENHWASEYISALSEMKIINGYTDGTFRPEALISREEFAKIIVTAFDLKYEGDSTVQFADVPESHWAHGCVTTAAELGVVKGVGDGVFGVGRNISRQDAAVMLYRASEYAGFAISSNDGHISFADNGSIAGYAAESVGKLSSAGIINGFSNGTFAPEKSLTRAEAAKIIFAMLTVR